MMNEILHASRCRHPNTIRMIGASIEGTRIRIIMAHAENGSLADALEDHWHKWMPPYSHGKNSDLFILRGVSLMDCKKKINASIQYPQQDDADVYYVPIKATRAGISFADVLWMMQGIAAGLDYLHSLEPPIIHYDLKPQNILLRSDGAPMISDFGLARTVQEITVRAGTQGSAKYISPELILGGLDSEISMEEGSGPEMYLKVDVYAFGQIAWQLIMGEAHIQREHLDAAICEAGNAENTTEGLLGSVNPTPTSATLNEDEQGGSKNSRDDSRDREVGAHNEWGDAQHDLVSGIQVIYLRDQGNFRLVLPTDTPQWLASLVRSCWTKRPKDRPSIRNIVDRLAARAPSNVV